MTKKYKKFKIVKTFSDALNLDKYDIGNIIELQTAGAFEETIDAMLNDGNMVCVSNHCPDCPKDSANTKSRESLCYVRKIVPHNGGKLRLSI